MDQLISQTKHPISDQRVGWSYMCFLKNDGSILTFSWRNKVITVFYSLVLFYLSLFSSKMNQWTTNIQERRNELVDDKYSRMEVVFGRRQREVTNVIFDMVSKQLVVVSYFIYMKCFTYDLSAWVDYQR